jgi:hypothetical protein
MQVCVQKSIQDLGPSLSKCNTIEHRKHAPLQGVRQGLRLHDSPCSERSIRRVPSIDDEVGSGHEARRVAQKAQDGSGC